MLDANRIGIRIGVLVAMFSTALMLPFFAVVSAEIKKIEGRLGLLAPVQFGGAIALVMIFQVIVIRAFNDYTWFAWSTFIATYSIQYLRMALMHRRARYEASRPTDPKDPEFSDLALL